LDPAIFVGERNVFSWSEDVCVEPETDLVIVSAPVVVVAATPLQL
jgi:hypothetical protein